MRGRAAGLLALAYLVCVVRSTLALAFADGAVAAHCLTDDHHRTTGHVHQDGMVHAHYGTQGSDQPANPDGKGTAGTLRRASTILKCNGPMCACRSRAAACGRILMLKAFEAALAGHGPHRIDRPPIVLASV